jgi:hypothetical protein
LKENSIQQYIRTIKKLEKTAYDQLQEKKIEDIYDEEDPLWFMRNPDILAELIQSYHYTTQRNYLTGVISVLKTEEKPDKQLLRKYATTIKKLNTKYDDINKEGYFTDKQEKNVTSMEKLNELLQKLKDDKNDQGYILFKMLMMYPLRNEIATFEKKTLQEYKKLKEKDKTGNYLVIGSRKIFISRNRYKTDKKYGEILTPVEDKQFQKEIREYVKNYEGEVFHFATKGDKKLQLSSYLAYLSKKYIGVRLGTTVIAKIVMSHRLEEIRLKVQKQNEELNEKIKQHSDVRGNSVETMKKIYMKHSGEDTENIQPTNEISQTQTPT